LIWLLCIVGGVRPSEVSVAYSSPAFILNLTMLQGLGTLGVDSWNFPSWSISVELLVNLFVLYPIVRTRSLTAAAVLIGLSLVAICRLWGPVFDLFNIQRIEGAVLSGGLLRGTAGILLGYLVYEAYLRLHPRIDGARFRMAATVCETMVITLLVFCLWIDNPSWNVLPVPLSALLVLQMALVPGHVSRLLQTGIFPLLGNISYSIYLMHIPLFLVATAMGWLRPPNSGFTLAWVVYFAVLLVLSAASFRCIERPAQRAMMRLFGGWGTTAVPS
jgi:peptidoglycan/LPS O-acetylase OafA/YrhL